MAAVGAVVDPVLWPALVLVAEVVAGELARCLGFETPRLVALELAQDLARYEADQEVQDLLRASVGLNLGVDFLPGAFGFEAGCEPDADLSAQVTEHLLTEVLALVPDQWLEPVPGATTPEELRTAYVAFLLARVAGVDGRRPWLPGPEVAS